MAQTEVTVQILDSKENVINKIQELGYVFQDTLTGNDSYFSIIDPKNATYKDLTNSSFIVREFHKKSTNNHQTMLVHKKKLFDKQNRVVGEEKTKVMIDSSNNAKQLLLNAGLNNWLSLKQQNSFFVNDEKTLIVGTVEGLDGTFLEVEEFESIKNKPENEKFKILCEFVDSLNLKTSNNYSCNKSYMLYNSQNNNQ